jgi:hypothetical protein
MQFGFAPVINVAAGAETAFSVGPASPVEEESFVERRAPREGFKGIERRQFSNSHAELSAPARELAMAVDAFKLGRHRRFISFEELLQVIEALGYRKN